MRQSVVEYSAVIALVLTMVFPQSQHHVCDEKDPAITKFFTLGAAGEFHCVFVPPNQDVVVKKVADGYTLTAHEARRYCERYNASLPLIRNAVMHKDLTFKLKADDPSVANRTSYPMGVKSQNVKAGPAGVGSGYGTFDNLTLNVTWLSGVSTVIRTKEFFRRLFSWTNAGKEGITYFRVFQGDFYTEKPENTLVDVKLVCHQDPDHPYTISDENPRDMCAGGHPDVKLVRRFYTGGGKTHCIFHAPLQAAALSKGDRQQGYEFTLDDLDTHCLLYDSRVLEIRDNETFHAVLAQATLWDSDYIIYPLGIANKIIIMGELEATEPPRYAVSSVTWDDGSEMGVNEEKSTVFGSVPWEVESPNGLTFLTMPEGRYITRDPTLVKGTVTILCHQRFRLSTIDGETVTQSRPQRTTNTPVKATEGVDPETASPITSPALTTTSSSASIIGVGGTMFATFTAVVIMQLQN